MSRQVSEAESAACLPNGLDDLALQFVEHTVQAAMKRAALPGTDKTLLASQVRCAGFYFLDLPFLMLLFGLGNRAVVSIDEVTYNLCLDPDGILFASVRFQSLSRRVTLEPRSLDQLP